MDGDQLDFNLAVSLASLHRAATKQAPRCSLNLCRSLVPFPQDTVTVGTVPARIRPPPEDNVA